MAKEALKPTTFLPDPRVDRAGESQAFYSLYYLKDSNDSPDGSRVSMSRRLHSVIRGIDHEALVLDIGAGKQILEAEYASKYGNPGARLITLDISDMERNQLLSPDMEHFIGNGEHMPFKDAAFSAAVSNMAIDFMDREALSEVARILKPGAKLLLNLHHPTLIPEDLNRRLRSFDQKMRFRDKTKPLTERQIMRKAILDHKRFLREGKILYESVNQIVETFEPIGFQIDRAEEVAGRDGVWWEADMTKK